MCFYKRGRFEIQKDDMTFHTKLAFRGYLTVNAYKHPGVLAKSREAGRTMLTCQTCGKCFSSSQNKYAHVCENTGVAVRRAKAEIVPSCIMLPRKIG